MAEQERLRVRGGSGSSENSVETARSVKDVYTSFLRNSTSWWTSTQKSQLETVSDSLVVVSKTRIGPRGLGLCVVESCGNGNERTRTPPVRMDESQGGTLSRDKVTVPYTCVWRVCVCRIQICSSED